METNPKSLSPVNLMIPGLVALSAVAAWQPTVTNNCSFTAVATTGGGTSATWSGTQTCSPNTVNLLATSWGNKRAGGVWYKENVVYGAGFMPITTFHTWDECTFSNGNSRMLDTDNYGRYGYGIVNSSSNPCE